MRSENPVLYKFNLNTNRLGLRHLTKNTTNVTMQELTDAI